MDKYKQLQAENQRFWESLDLNKVKLSAQDFETLAQEETDEPVIELEALSL